MVGFEGLPDEVFKPVWRNDDMAESRGQRHDRGIADVFWRRRFGGMDFGQFADIKQSHRTRWNERGKRREFVATFGV